MTDLPVLGSLYINYFKPIQASERIRHLIVALRTDIKITAYPTHSSNMPGVPQFLPGPVKKTATGAKAANAISM